MYQPLVSRAPLVTFISQPLHMSNHPYMSPPSIYHPLPVTHNICYSIHLPSPISATHRTIPTTTFLPSPICAIPTAFATHSTCVPQHILPLHIYITKIFLKIFSTNSAFHISSFLVVGVQRSGEQGLQPDAQNP